MVKVKKPILVFLMETKLRSNKMEKVRWKLGFNNMFVVDCVGKSGGLAMLWQNEAGAEIQNFSRRHINATVNYPTGTPPWKLTCFYGHPEACKRAEAWDLLTHISRMEPEPWICFGYFNEIVSLSEKWGGSGRQRGLMEAFQKTLEDCSLADLGYRGPKYTWTNCKEDKQFTKERLDRVIANRSWCDLNREVDVVVGAALSSNHSPIFINLLGGVYGQQGQKLFRYEAHWESETKCHEIITQAWEDWGTQIDPWQNLGRRIERCKKGLQKWNNAEVGQPKKLMENKMKLFREMQDEWRWKQWAKIEWLKHGDKNSKFFHACANQRRARNKIRAIQDEHGRIAETQEEIGGIFVDYFMGQFTAGELGNMEECVGAKASRVTEEMNGRLLQPFSANEMRIALFQMAPLKAPGPDGLTVGFFQKPWNTVGPEVSKAILHTLECGLIPNDLNDTFIALIPKSKNPKSAFIPGRLITDNVLAAYETLHTMKTRMRGKKGYMAVKIDMSKAYDRVEWHFLQESRLCHWTRLTNILKTYEVASGQRLNASKTAILFSQNTRSEVKQHIIEVSGVPSSQRYDKYLGLPVLVGKSRTKEFRSIIDHVWKRLQDWKVKLLSQAGKEVLLKAVIQAIPTYCMSLFMLPKGLRSEINSIMQRFWWGNQSSGSGIHWLNWSKMGEAKNCGGMGFRDFKCFNKALLAKQYWRLWNLPNSLVSQIMAAKYYPHGSALEAQLGNKPSFAWRSIWGLGDLLKDGLVWRIGNDATVQELIDQDTRWWNVGRLEQLFSPEEIQAIMTIPISCTNKADVLIWRGTKTGSFSVRSAYFIAKSMEVRARASSSIGAQNNEAALNAFREANLQTDHGREEVSRLHVAKWVGPNPGWIKINWDAAVCIKQGIFGMGAVARDGEGTVLAAHCLVGRGSLDPYAAETWAGVQAA
ncbi:uncharacterized protein LOC132188495 [Corylus avellana]|uniref:uncharacterized protein LOC132188495 n=1 Tax=Corylus avellana TaxID=13451 RepID=UPI00286A7BF5|nr:uncharacterized protein LOC132188495 [Corylus avellana]